MGVQVSQDHLSSQEYLELMACIGRNRDVFATNLSELETTNLYEHTIDTKDATPIRQRFYRTNPEIKKEIERQCTEMEKYGIIESAVTEWQSPVVMIKKKNNEYRFAVDYRKLNKHTVPSIYPLPRLDDVLDTLGDAKANIFSTIDLCSGFWQIPVAEESRDKTGFVTHHGVWRFRKLPFGLVNSPSTFALVMAKALDKINWKFAMTYVDDILVFSSNFKQHLHHLQTIFERLRACKLKIKPSKCHFAAESVNYLGHVITKEGVTVDKTKISAVKDFPPPTSEHDLRSYLGLASYYRRFVKGFAHIAAPLFNLLKKGENFVWDHECQTSFDKLKQCLTEAPVLIYPDMNRPFYLTTDASGFAIAYILSQEDASGKLHPVAYGGRALSCTEKKWSVSERECLAVLQGIKFYNSYLSDNKFTIITDHACLKWLQSVKTDTGRLARWSLMLQGYRYEVQHRPGTSIRNADALSRRKYPSDPTNSSTDIEDSLLDITNPSPAVVPITTDMTTSTGPAIVYIETAATDLPCPVTGIPATPPASPPEEHCRLVLSVSIEDIDKEQSLCPEIGPIKEHLLTGNLPADDSKARKLLLSMDQFIIQENLLYHLYTPRLKIKSTMPQDDNSPFKLVKQLVVPKSMRGSILEAHHDGILGGGHQGAERTYAAVRQRYYWPRMYTSVFNYVKHCDLCQKSKRLTRSATAPLYPLPVVGLFDRWHIDILGPLTTTNHGFKYVLVIVESFSKWCELIPLKSQEANEIAWALYTEIFTRFGAPKCLVSDRGQNFLSKIVTAFCRLFNVERFHTSPYHPQTNSACERLNSVITQTLRTYIDENHNTWPHLLPAVAMAYRLTPSTRASQFSPFYLLFGQEMRTPLDASLPDISIETKTNDNLKEAIDRLKLFRSIASQNIRDTKSTEKANHDKNIKEQEFKVGDRVLMQQTARVPGRAPKLCPKWHGPYYITEIPGKNTVRLRRCSDNKVISSRINITRLRLYTDPADRVINPSKITPVPPNQTPVTPPPPPQPPRDSTPTTTRSASPTRSQPDADGQPDMWFPAEKLLRARGRGKNKQYLVKWEGNYKNTWQRSEDVSPFLIRQFYASK